MTKILNSGIILKVRGDIQMGKVKLSLDGKWYVIILFGVMTLALILWFVSKDIALNHNDGGQVRYTFPFVALLFVLAVGIVVSCCLRHYCESKNLPTAKAKKVSKKR